MAAAIRVVTYYAVSGGAGPGAADRLAALSRTTAAFARARRLVVIEPFVEVRRGRARPELARALARCRAARAALLVPSLAAVGGDLAFPAALLHARGAVLAGDPGPARPPVLRPLPQGARDAQSTASDRSRHALRAARRRGVKLGSPRPEIGSRAGVAALRARADAHAAELAPAMRELLLSNPTASLRDLAALLEELALPTPRRGRWGPSAVRNALRRAGLAARN